MGADYASAIWTPADPTNYRRGRAVKAPTLIVIHCTDGHPQAEGVAEMWQQPRHLSSAHFVVGQDGAVIQAVRIADTAWHAHGANACSVGIEHCARTPGEWSATDPGLTPSDALYGASAKLVAWLCVTLGLRAGRAAIVGHAEADSTTSHRRCPNGCGWDWTHYMDLVTAEYARAALVA